MSELVTQKEKTTYVTESFGKKILSAKEIIPRWFNKLTGKKDDERLAFFSPTRCLVGEAHGFPTYPAIYDNCNACVNFSGTLSSVVYEYPSRMTERNNYTEEELENHPELRKFVKHWNEVHVK